MCSSVVYVHTGRTRSEIVEYRCEEPGDDHVIHRSLIRSPAMTRDYRTDQGVRTHSRGGGPREEYGPSSEAVVQVRWYARP